MMSMFGETTGEVAGLAQAIGGPAALAFLATKTMPAFSAAAPPVALATAAMMYGGYARGMSEDLTEMSRSPTASVGSFSGHLVTTASRILDWTGVKSGGDWLRERDYAPALRGLLEYAPGQT